MKWWLDSFLFLCLCPKQHVTDEEKTLQENVALWHNVVVQAKAVERRTRSLQRSTKRGKPVSLKTQTSYEEAFQSIAETFSLAHSNTLRLWQK